MTLRCFRERCLQTVSFELVGIGFVSPLYAYLAGTPMLHGFALITILSIAILIWSPVFNTVYDLIERHRTGRVASQRPHASRVIHAILHEVSAILLTCPLLMWMGGHTLEAALAFNLGLTLTYSVYTYVFHIAYDQIRPVQMVPQRVISK